MATATEGKHAGEFVAWDQGEHSRDNVTVLSGQVLTPGKPVGKVNVTGVGGAVAVLSGTSPGDGTLTDIIAGPDVEAGAYLVQCTAIATHGGTFSVTSPSGKLVGTVTMAGGSGAATRFTSSHLSFTLTDGSTDFALTALFTITVGTTAPVVLGGTGTGTISLITRGRLTQRGQYRVINRAVVAHGGDFEVLAPDGSSVGRFLMGTTTGGAAAFTSDHLNFTLTDATDFILGNEFRVVAFGPAAAPKIAAWDPTAVDGRQHMAGLSWDHYDATAGDVKGVIESRWAVVNGAELDWGTFTAGQQAAGEAALTALGIVVR